MTEEHGDDDLMKMIQRNKSVMGEAIQIVHRYKNNNTRNPTFTAVVEVTPKCFRQIMDGGRLFIKWESCRVVEDINVMRCFKCCGYNHKATDCKNNIKCVRCAGDHDVKSCKANEMKCVNCASAVEKFNANLTVNHTASDKNCTIYRNKLEVMRRKVNTQ